MAGRFEDIIGEILIYATAATAIGGLLYWAYTTFFVKPKGEEQREEVKPELTAKLRGGKLIITAKCNGVTKTFEYTLKPGETWGIVDLRRGRLPTVAGGYKLKEAWILWEYGKVGVVFYPSGAKVVGRYFFKDGDKIKCVLYHVQIPENVTTGAIGTAKPLYWVKAVVVREKI